MPPRPRTHGRHGALGGTHRVPNADTTVVHRQTPERSSFSSSSNPASHPRGTPCCTV
jgi:hypothetical protein